MKAMIFSAGLGTRLYPLTKNKPKALAPFGDSTLLKYNLSYLANQGINSFIINTHHFSDEIEKYLNKNNFFGLDIIISHETQLLDTAGGVAKIRELIDEEQLLLYNVDVISNIKIDDFYHYHCDNNADISLATRKRETSRYLLFDENNRMIGWKNNKNREIKVCRNKSKANNLAFSGMSIINSNILKDIGEAKKKSLITFYLEICDSRNILAYVHDKDYWFDCGTVEKLKRAEKFIFQP